MRHGQAESDGQAMYILQHGHWRLAWPAHGRRHSGNFRPSFETFLDGVGAVAEEATALTLFGLRQERLAFFTKLVNLCHYS